MSFVDKKKIFVFWTFFVGLILSILVFFLFSYGVERIIQLDFEKNAENWIFEIELGIDLNLDALESIGSFYDASQYVNREEFKLFVGNRLMKYKSIQALEWIPKVLDSENQ